MLKVPVRYIFRPTKFHCTKKESRIDTEPTIHFMHAKRQRTVQSASGVQMIIRSCNKLLIHKKGGTNDGLNSVYRTGSSLDMAKVTIIYILKME